MNAASVRSIIFKGGDAGDVSSDELSDSSFVLNLEESSTEKDDSEESSECENEVENGEIETAQRIEATLNITECKFK